ncbi:hypothetical protein H4R35_001943 [Dimargaris xerosporica]|nr:hypothetical protein H4R35_001943 [Dimargaris xerosporica]
MALHPTLYDYLKRRLNHLKSELPRVLNEINELEQLLHTPVSLPATPAKPSRSFLDGAHAPLPEKPSPPGVESAPKPSIQPSKRCRHNPQLQAHQDPTLERLEVIGQHTSAESHATPKMS